MDIPRFITIVLPIAAVQFAMREALLERAKLRPGLAIFPTILSFRVLFVVGPLMFLYGAYQIAREAQVRFDYFLVSIMIGFAFLAFSVDQGTIQVSDEGVSFRRWYRLRRCEIPWNAVRSAVSVPALRTITVFAKDDRMIVHTQWHVAPSTFEAVLIRRVGSEFIRR